MTHKYQATQRDMQDTFDTRRMADQLSFLTSDQIDDAHKAFIEARDMFFIATADENGAPQCSYKGGEPGFVRVLDASNIAFPAYDGNGMYLTAGNITVNPQVGLLFLDFKTGTRLRLNGVASIDMEGLLVDSYPGAQFVVRVEAKEVFANCRRYVHRHDATEHSEFVPTSEHVPPVPDWKRHEWFKDALPANDPALDPDSPTAPAFPEF